MKRETTKKSELARLNAANDKARNAWRATIETAAPKSEQKAAERSWNATYRGGPGGKKGDRRGLGVADSQSIQETTGGRKQIRTGTTCLERGVSGMGERNGEGGKRRQ